MDAPRIRRNLERIREPDTSGPEVEARLLQLRERSLEALSLIEGVPAEGTRTTTTIPAVTDVRKATMASSVAHAAQ